MGKGNYRGSKEDSIMFWLTTDYNVNCDIEPFHTYEINGDKWWKTNIHYEDYSYELKTRHFNMNIHAKDIVNHLSEYGPKDFKYLKSDCRIWEAIKQLLPYDNVKIGNTYYIPKKFKIEQEIIINGKPLCYYHNKNAYETEKGAYDMMKFYRENVPEIFL